MPYAPLRPCTWPGCGQLSNSYRCELHAKREKREIDARRGTATQRGYDARWNKARKQFLGAHPLCAICRDHGRVSAATIVDHIKPHKGNMTLFWDVSNWEALCKACHDSKTASVDGRWG